MARRPARCQGKCCAEQGTRRSKLRKTTVETGLPRLYGAETRQAPSLQGIRQAVLRFDGLRACFHSLGCRSIGFPMTDWRDVRLGKRPCERPRLLVTTRQHEVETAAWGCRSAHLINAVARFQS